MTRLTGGRVLAVAGGLGVLALVAPARAEDGALDVRRVSAEQRRRLLRGDVISYAVGEGSERELTAGLAMFLPVAVSEIVPSLSGGELIEHDPGLAAFAPIGDSAGPAAFAAVRFGARDLAEAQALLDAGPGFRFNLSGREMDALRSARGEVAQAAAPARLEAASRQYRRLLFERWQAYRHAGLDGMAPYVRPGAVVTDPAAELRAVAADPQVVAHLLPLLPEALMRYPGVQLSPTASRFYWVRRLLQGRPATALIHLITDARPELILYVERHFYVGHSYNVSQTISGAVPYEGGTLVFATTRVSTDQVTGVGGELKRAIGRRQLRAEIFDRFDRIRAFLAKPVRPESP